VPRGWTITTTICWIGLDFLQITKKIYRQIGKKRKLQECPLDDSLTSKQKTAVEEVTYLFPQMSPKTIMMETLRVLDAASSAENIEDEGKFSPADHRWSRGG